jgi:hypothetical protein
MPIKNPIERKKYDKKYYQKNKDRRKEISKLWRENNRESYNKHSNRSYYKNRKKVIKNNIEYERKKLKTDMGLVLRKRLRNRVYKVLKGKNKSKSTMELLSIPHLDFLKIYIECKFKEGMTWENRNLWHIDHIKPCSSFDLTKPEEQAKCFHYTNLQPLWASENLSKGNRIS